MAHLHKHERVGRLGKSGGEKKAHPLRKQKTTKGRAPSLPGPRLGAAVCTGTSALPLREAKQRLRHPSGESAERISRLEERMAHASVVHVMLVLEVNSKSGPFQKIKGSGTRRGEAAASHGCLRGREGNPKTQVPTPNLGHPPRFSVTEKLRGRGFRSTAQDRQSGRPFAATRPTPRPRFPPRTWGTLHHSERLKAGSSRCSE